MARIGIMTFLHNDNYGSSLQAYALQRVIRTLGYDCEHIDYRPDRAEKIRNLLGSGNHPKLIIDGLRKRSVKAGQEGARKKSGAIPAFYRECMQLSPVCRNRKELAERAGRYDILLCGSDQIWNPVWLNPAYFLTFAPESMPKVAYAASLGIRTMPAAGKVRKIRNWTKGFRAVSVREQEGAELLEQMTGIRADVTPDPVCLLDRTEWEALAAPGPGGDPYILCYFIGENDEYTARVKKLQAETGLRVLDIPVNAGSYRSGRELLDGISPREFLGAVRNAEVLCTDSFHGLAFATIFGVKTELIRRYREDEQKRKNSRVDHFLRLVNEKGTDRIREEGTAWLRDALSRE